MKYNVILNKSSNTTSIFKTYLKEGTETLSIATAFIDDYTIEFLRKTLSLPVGKRPRIEFLTGLFGHFNRKRNLIELQKLNASNWIKIRISRNEKFHWKYYAFRQQHQFTFFAGSANFTKNGFTSDGEFLVQFTEQVTRSAKSKLYALFSHEFERAFDIDELDFERYDERKIPNALPHEDEIFPTIKRRKPIKGVKYSKLCRIIKVQYSTSRKEAKKLYEEKSNWADKGWGFYAFSDKAHYDAALKAKYLLNIYRKSGKYSMDLSEIMDWDVLPIGNRRYFIAIAQTKTIDLTIAEVIEIERIIIDFRTRPNRWKERYSDKKTNELIKRWFGI